MKKNSVFILDSYGLIYRSYFGFISRPLTNSKGENVSAIYGFFNSLYSLLQKYNPKIVIAAMDSLTPTFRHEMYPEYKITRDKTPEDLHAQIPIIEEILTALGISSLRFNGFEADDIIATLAKKSEMEGRETYVISSDKDLLQLVNDKTFILKSGKIQLWQKFGVDEVKAEWGVLPENILDVLSLMGDTADNVPGVAGVGIKTAQKLLTEYKSLDGIFENVNSIKGAVQKKLIAGKDNAYFSKKLIALNYEVPITQTLDSFEVENFNIDSAIPLFDFYELPALSKLYNNNTEVLENTKLENKNDDNKNTKLSETVILKTPLEEIADVHNDGLIKTDGKYKCVQDENEFAKLIEKSIESKVIAFDCETTSTNSLNTNLVGFSISFNLKEAYYFPVLVADAELGGEVEKTVSLDSVRKNLTKIFSNSNVLLVMHNGKFDLQVMQSCNIISQVNATIFDTMVGAWLLDPGRGTYNLDSLSSMLLGIETIKYKDIVPKGLTFKDVPLNIATEYASEDADLTYRLYKKIEPALKKHKCIDLFNNMEMPILNLLSQMEQSGIYLSIKELNDFSKSLGKDILKCEKDIFEMVGHEFNIASPKQLQEILFTERNLTPGKKTKTGYSTDTSVLENLASEDEVVEKILDYRVLSKLKSTYADSLPLLADATGRIHTSFVQTGTATGRLSSRDPNLQNIPIKDELGRKIRKAFYATDGNVLVTADYSQIELVILAHLSKDENLMSAFNNGIDVHSKTASLIFNCSIDDVQSDMRRIAKTINFGVMYGMSAFRLANQLRIPRKQAANFIDSYFKTYSGVSNFMHSIKVFAEENGYVETIMGRRRYISNINSRNRIEKAGAERIAVNTSIQGSAADVVKSAMLSVVNSLHESNLNAKLLLQVHDELIFECPKTESDNTISVIKNKMENVIQLSVPLKVSIENGKSWGDFH